MTDIYLHCLFAHYGLYGNAPVNLAQSRGLRHNQCPAKYRAFPAPRPIVVAPQKLSLQSVRLIEWQPRPADARTLCGLRALETQHGYTDSAPILRCRQDHIRRLRTPRRLLPTVCFQIIGNLETMHD